MEAGKALANGVAAFGSRFKRGSLVTGGYYWGLWVHCLELDLEGWSWNGLVHASNSEQEVFKSSKGCNQQGTSLEDLQEQWTGGKLSCQPCHLSRTNFKEPDDQPLRAQLLGIVRPELSSGPDDAKKYLNRASYELHHVQLFGAYKTCVTREIWQQMWVITYWLYHPCFLGCQMPARTDTHTWTHLFWVLALWSVADRALFQPNQPM